jgi:hypothetical protein
MSATYFARIDDNNKVIDVAVTSAEFMAANPERYPGTWVETFFDRADKQYAGIGFTYDPATQDFTEPPFIPVS